MMSVAESVRLNYELEVYCVSRLCDVVWSKFSILPCFVLEEVVAVKAQAGVVRKEREPSSQADLFLMRVNTNLLH